MTGKEESLRCGNATPPSTPPLQPTVPVRRSFPDFYFGPAKVKERELTLLAGWLANQARGSTNSNIDPQLG